MSSFFARGRALGSRLISKPAVTSTVIGGGVGALTSWIAQMLVEHTDFFNKYWYAPALAVGVGGHVVKSMQNQQLAGAGMAAVGAAGSMGYYSYKLHKASKAASGETSGVQRDTGAPALDEYAAAIRSLPDVGGVQEGRASGGAFSRMRTAA